MSRKMLDSTTVFLIASGGALMLPESATHAQSGAQEQRGDLRGGDIQQQLSRAATMVRKMKADPTMAALLGTARGIFLSCQR